MSVGRACRCGGTIRDGKCDRCKPVDTGHKWRHLYRTSRWLRARLLWLANNPLCAECERNGQTQEASVVDHIQPHRGDLSLFWDATNWQSLCLSCHGRKSGRGE